MFKGLTVAFGLAFAAIFGIFGGLDHVAKFGANAALSTSYEDVWDAGGTYDWLTSAITMQLSSADANDTSAGTGCRTVRVEGLDANYAKQSEDFSLNGQTQVTGTLTFLRVFRAYCLTAGSGDVNAGNIHVSDSGAPLASGVPSTPTANRAQITAGNGQTLMAIYTVPAGRDAQVISVMIGNDDDSKAATFQLMTRDLGGAWRVRWQGTTNGQPHQEGWSVPFKLKPKTDVRVRAKTDTGAAAGNATFQLSMD